MLIFLQETDLLVNLMDSVFVPKHQTLLPEEKKALVEKYKINSDVKQQVRGKCCRYQIQAVLCFQTMEIDRSKQTFVHNWLITLDVHITNCKFVRPFSAWIDLTDMFLYMLCILESMEQSAVAEASSDRSCSSLSWTGERSSSQNHSPWWFWGALRQTSTIYVPNSHLMRRPGRNIAIIMPSAVDQALRMSIQLACTHGMSSFERVTVHF